MVHDANEYWFKGMDKEKVYYFSIEAINENGVSAKSKLVRSSLNPLENNVIKEIKYLAIPKKD
jgi:hypothetical protein